MFGFTFVQERHGKWMKMIRKWHPSPSWKIFRRATTGFSFQRTRLNLDQSTGPIFVETRPETDSPSSPILGHHQQWLEVTALRPPCFWGSPNLRNPRRSHPFWWGVSCMGFATLGQLLPRPRSSRAGLLLLEPQIVFHTSQLNGVVEQEMRKSPTNTRLISCPINWFFNKLIS